MNSLLSFFLNSWETTILKVHCTFPPWLPYFQKISEVFFRVSFSLDTFVLSAHLNLEKIKLYLLLSFPCMPSFSKNSYSYFIRWKLAERDKKKNLQKGGMPETKKGKQKWLERKKGGGKRNKIWIFKKKSPENSTFYKLYGQIDR